MNKSIAEMLKKGYILFPKVLFEEQMKMTKNATGSFNPCQLQHCDVSRQRSDLRMPEGRIGDLPHPLGESVRMETQPHTPFLR